jgi:FtsP/CotA-like multicopper oxidase with cupredoxin domain
VRVSVLNASNANYLHLDWPGARVIGGEQGWRAAPTDVLPVLAPGDRMVLEVRPGTEPVDVLALPVSLFGGPSPMDAPRRVATVRPDPGAPAAAEPVWPFTGAVPSADGPADLVFTLSGDGSDWRINQETWPDVTIPEVSLGTSLVVEVRNLSGARHPWHLHGLPFEVLSVDGVPPPEATFEDTFDVDLRQTLRTRVLADLAGDWMAHCHILPHAHDGMMTVLRVVE